MRPVWTRCRSPSRWTAARIRCIAPARAPNTKHLDGHRAGRRLTDGDGGKHPQPGHKGLRGLRRRPDQSAQRRRQGARRRGAVGNVDAAKTAYAKARLFYERAESSVEGFVLPGFAVDDNAGNLDYLIDMRASTPVDAKVGWKGFHAIERDLWQGGAITPAPRR